jgi:hypothetical protein
MILDSHGAPLRRSIGFIRAYVPERRALPIIGGLSLVGFEVPLLEDEEEEDAARTRERMRRAA